MEMRTSETQPAPSASTGALHQWPWLPYVLPLFVFLGVTTLEPSQGSTATAAWLGGVPLYPAVYVLKIALVLLAVALAWPVFRTYPLRVGGLSLVIGALGGVLWIALAQRGWEVQLLDALGIGGLVNASLRSGYDPFTALGGTPAVLYGFLVLRFVGLALLVPIAEEFFLRGFVMRYVAAPDWERVPFGTVTGSVIAAAVIYPLLSHPPNEAIAAVAWFGLVTWLMARTRNIWDCVAAHAVTNLMLGVYVVATGRWSLW